MNLTPYNLNHAVEMLQARAFLLLMSGEVRSLDGENAAALFEIVGDMTEEQAHAAIREFEATQW